MIKSVSPNEVKVNITVEDNGLRSNLINNETKKFTEKSFFYTNLGFTQSGSGQLGDIKGFIQTFWDTYKNEKPNNIT